MEHGASRRYHGHRGAGRSSPSGVHAARDARLGPRAGYAAVGRALGAPSRRTRRVRDYRPTRPSERSDL